MPPVTHNRAFLDDMLSQINRRIQSTGEHLQSERKAGILELQVCNSEGCKMIAQGNPGDLYTAALQYAFFLVTEDKG